MTNSSTALDDAILNNDLGSVLEKPSADKRLFNTNNNIGNNRAQAVAGGVRTLNRSSSRRTMTNVKERP